MLLPFTVVALATFCCQWCRFSAAAAAQYTPHGIGCLDAATQALPFCNTSLALGDRVANLVSLLTLEEKIGLTGSTQPALQCSDIDSGVPRLGIPNVTQLIELTGTVSSSCYVDADGGSFCPTVFPSPLLLAASFDRNLWRLKGAVTGTEARAFNNLHVTRIYSALNFVDLIGFGPDLNLIVDPRNGRNGENPSECPTLAGFYAEEFVKGIQEGEDSNYLQLATGLKHAAVYQYETSRFSSDNNVTNFDLLDTYLPPFARGFIEGNAAGSMCAYDSINGVPSCANEWFLGGLIRGFWGRADSFITSDCTAIENEYTAKGWTNSYANATALSILAGTDSCIGTAFQAENGIRDALSEGLMGEADLDSALTRTLAVRFRLGMFDPPNSTIYTTYGPERIHTPASAAAATNAAAAGAVLLRNEGNVLPLDAWAPSLRSIAVVGPHAVTQEYLLGDYYGDAFCPGVTTPSNKSAACVPSFGAAMASYLASPRPDVAVGVAEGVGIVSMDASGVAAALALVSVADAVILAVGYSNQDIEHEGADHPNTTLPGLQGSFSEQVISAAAARGVPVIMVVINAGQIALDTLPALPPAIVEAFYPGFGAPAIVAQLFGETNAWGRLPYTIYDSSFPNAVALTDVAVSTGIGRTYRYYTGVPLWPFGHGLSYSFFSSDCTGSAPSPSFPASQNFSFGINCSTGLQAGSVAGDEILLVYHRAGDDVRRSVNGSHPVPFFTLRDFARLANVSSSAAAMASSFALEPIHLALVNAAGASVLYPGTHYIDISPRPPAANITFAITISGASPVVLEAPPPYY